MRVAFIIGRIDREHPRPDPPKQRFRVKIPRCLIHIDKVIGVRGCRLGQALIQDGIRRRAGGCGFLQRLRPAIGRDIEEQERERKGSRLAGVIPPLIGRVAADGFDHHAPQHPIPPGHGGGLRCHGHDRIHEIRMRHPPKPGQHAAHGIADHQPDMADAKAFGQQPVLGGQDIGVVELRKTGPKPIRWLGGSACPQRIRDDDVVLRRIQSLARAEKLTGEGRRDHAARRPRRAMQHQNRGAEGLPNRQVAKAEFRHHLTAMEAEIPRDPGGFAWFRI